MVSQEIASHQRLQQLIDLRVVHQIHRGYADKDNPGIRYNIYTLDYGTYVGLKRTAAEPEITMIETVGLTEEDTRIVPYDDRRSIRRIIVGKDILDAQ